MERFIVCNGVKIISNGLIFDAGQEISKSAFSTPESFENALSKGKIKKCNTAALKAEIENSVSEVTHAESVNLEGETGTENSNKKSGKKRKSR